MADISKPIYGDIWANSGEKLSPSNTKIASGWVQEMMPYQFENFLQNRTDTAISYLLQKGIAEWSADQEYVANKSVVTYASQLYMATATTTNVLPTVTASWKRLTISLGVNGAVPVSFGGTGATNAADARVNLGIGTSATADFPVANGLISKLADNTLAVRTITGTTGYITVTNGDGVSGNPTINVGNNVAKTDADAAWTTKTSIRLPSGSTAERGAAVSGRIRFNTELNKFEGYNGNSWNALGASSDIEITTLSGNGVTTVFTLNTAVFSEVATDVFVGGIYQNKSTYTVSGASITFSEAPPADTNNIQVLSRRVVDLGLSTASQVSIEDTTNLYISSTVEGALREVGDKAKFVKNAILSYPDDASANAAAATLPDGVAIIVDGVSLGRVESGFYVPTAGVPTVTCKNYGELRSYSGPASIVDVTDFGISGRFSVVASGSDNGMTVIVGLDGRVWKRNNVDEIKAEWSVSTGIAGKITDSIAAASDGDTIRLPAGTFDIATTIPLDKDIAIISADYGTRGVLRTTLNWTGAANGIVFNVAKWPTAIGVVIRGIAFTGNSIAVSGKGAFHTSIERCSFTRPTYGDAVVLSESTPGANDGSYWSIIERNTFTNCRVSVLGDSNSTRINMNDWFAGDSPMAGPGLYAENVDMLVVTNNTLEGAVAAGQYFVYTSLVEGLVFTGNRIENYSGGSAYFSQPAGCFDISGNFFNTPYEVGGSRNTFFHNLGQGFFDAGNILHTKTGGVGFSEVNNLNGVFPTSNLFKIGPIGSEWYFFSNTRMLVEDGSLGLRSPVLRLSAPTSTVSTANQNFDFQNLPEVQLAMQCGMFVTAVFIARAGASNTGRPCVYINTQEANPELWDVPRDGRWHTIRVTRRLNTAESAIRPTVALTYGQAGSAGDTLDVAGIGFYIGTAAYDLPFFDAGTTDPVTNGNSKTFRIGDRLRNIAPASGAPAGWVCTASGSPGVWRTEGSIS